MIYLMISLAIFNGLLSVLSRLINAKLGLYITATGAAFWNHLIGTIFLISLLPLIHKAETLNIKVIPYYLFFGGLIGACYVAINNLVVPKLGAIKATVLVIAGQIILGTIIDTVKGQLSVNTYSILGIGLVLFGVWVGGYKKKDNI